MKILTIFIFLLLSNCTGYSVASLASNIASYSATGKTNTDHVASLVTGKDCKIVRVLKEENYCKDKNFEIVENKNIENINLDNLKIVENDSNLLFAESNEDFEEKKNIKLAYNNAEIVFNKFYYGSITWAEQQLKRGTIISDEIGITEDLTSKIENVFDNYFY
tara:strand:- start:1790 stop:2278 length:489 start_codon:yes stop_codon:yes gene_type:complete